MRKAKQIHSASHKRFQLGFALFQLSLRLRRFKRLEVRMRDRVRSNGNPLVVP